MKTAARIEFTLIALGGVVVRLAEPLFPEPVRLGTLLVAGSGLLLFQGLIRDLCLLARARREPPKPKRAMACMCVESTAGVAGMIIGATLFGSAINLSVSPGPWGWPAMALGVMALGFLFRDYVIGWRPLRFNKDPDHLNIVFTWKK